MTLKFKVDYLDAIRERYYKAPKATKTKILDELCAVTGFHRKYAIRILAKRHHQGPKKSGRTKVYSDASIFHLKRLWHLMGRMCSKKMVAAFPTWLDYYDGKGFGPLIKAEILSMSPATVDRYLKAYKTQFARSRRSGTIRGPKKFRNVVPLKCFEEKHRQPGYVEADTVAHCGDSISGKFIWSLTITDVYSGWTDNRAMFHKTADGTLSAIGSIVKNLPYDLHSFNVDNGTEFLNRYLVEFFEGQRASLTRSRAYRKNDNCHVEQKNFTHVREYFGYDRLDEERLVKYMNEIYRFYLNPLLNFFTPQLKLTQKERVGSRYVRKYDSPKTPYQRLMESSHLSMKQKADLELAFKRLNPIMLKKRLSSELKQFQRLLHEEIKIDLG